MRIHTWTAFCLVGVTLLTFPALAQNAPSLHLLLPERTRLLADQRVDLLLEARNIRAGGTLTLIANGRDISSSFSQPTTVDLDCDGQPDLVYRANLQSFSDPGYVTVSAQLAAGGQTYTDTRNIYVQNFSLAFNHAA